MKKYMVGIIIAHLLSCLFATFLIAETTVIIQNNTSQTLAISLATNYKDASPLYEQNSKCLKPTQKKKILWIEDPTTTQEHEKTGYAYDMTLAGKDIKIMLKQRIQQTIEAGKKNTAVQHAAMTPQETSPTWYKDTKSHKCEIPGSKSSILVTSKKTIDKKKNSTVIEYNLQENYKPLENTNPQQLHILSWNVDMKPYQLIKNGQHQRACLLAEFLSGYDVVILSELFDQVALQTITQKLASKYPYCTASTKQCSNHGVVIYSKWPLEALDYAPFEALCAGFDCQLSKGIVYARISKHGQPYNIFGTTLQDWPSNRSALIRTEQLKKIKAFIDEHALPYSEPIIISGAFNINKYKSSFDNKTRNEYKEMLHILSVNPGTHIGYEFTVDPSTNSLSRDIDPKEFNDYVLYAADYRKPKQFSSEVCIFKSPKSWHERFREPNQDLSSHFALRSVLEY